MKKDTFTQTRTLNLFEASIRESIQSPPITSQMAGALPDDGDQLGPSESRILRERIVDPKSSEEEISDAFDIGIHPAQSGSREQ
jgi:hypothetical protein